MPVSMVRRVMPVSMVRRVMPVSTVRRVMPVSTGPSMCKYPLYYIIVTSWLLHHSSMYYSSTGSKVVSSTGSKVVSSTVRSK